jgi:tRNA threonylcarbamoyladenosine biosynthesis protein TsaB
MNLILNIDTATETAVISLSGKDNIIDAVINSNQKDHASFLHPAIKNLFQKANLPINKLNAIAVTAGPGSYTGLRVGMAAAKGLCYALNIPLIAISTLEVMALSSIKQIQDPSALYCPLIDARRMEVFTAIYDQHLTEIIMPCAMILEDGAFKNVLQTNKIYFSGSGAAKLKLILDNYDAVFINSAVQPNAMAQLAYKNFLTKTFANINYTSPVYLKEFYTPSEPGI